MMQVSQAGMAMIERFEGKRNHAYRDIRGIWTCGIGETGPDIGPNTFWTDSEVDEHFAHRLSDDFEPSVNKLIGDAPTTQGQFDALVSLAYNIGVGGFGRSSVLRFHRQRDYDDAADAFCLWYHVGSSENDALYNRRVEEAQLYLDSSPDA
jgi:lysozyme